MRIFAMSTCSRVSLNLQVTITVGKYDSKAHLTRQVLVKKSGPSSSPAQSAQGTNADLRQIE